MPTKIRCDNATGWTNPTNITGDDSDATTAFIDSHDGTPASDQQSVTWNSQVFSNYHFINLHVVWSTEEDVTASAGTGSSTVHIEYDAGVGAGFVDIYHPDTGAVTIGPATDNNDQAQTDENYLSAYIRIRNRLTTRACRDGCAQGGARPGRISQRQEHKAAIIVHVRLWLGRAIFVMLGSVDMPLSLFVYSQLLR